MFQNRSNLGVILFTFLVLVIFACGGSGNEQNKTTSSNPVDMENHPGAFTYKKLCASCHQSDGSGVSGLYPPISGTKMVNGEKAKLIDIILNGQSGEIEVKGEIYNNVMPSHKHLTDQQVADLLTYVKNNFDNEGGEVTAQEVAEVRKSTK